MLSFLGNYFLSSSRPRCPHAQNHSVVDTVPPLPGAHNLRPADLALIGQSKPRSQIGARSSSRTQGTSSDGKFFSQGPIRTVFADSPGNGLSCAQEEGVLFSLIVLSLAWSFKFGSEVSQSYWGGLHHLSCYEVRQVAIIQKSESLD